MKMIVSHTHDIDVETDTMIRLDTLDAMITILRTGLDGDNESVPTTCIIKTYLFHLGQIGRSDPAKPREDYLPGDFSGFPEGRPE